MATNCKKGEMATDYDIDRVRPRFMGGKCWGGLGLEHDTRARVYHDRCEEILEVVKAGGTRDFIGDIQESILHDPYRYPTERQRWWVDHYHGQLVEGPGQAPEGNLQEESTWTS
jgi:hypothetical protein